MAEENKDINDKTELTFVNEKLNELSDIRRKHIDDATKKLFFLGEAFGYTVVKKHLDKNNGVLNKEDYNNFLAQAMNVDIVGAYLEPMIMEYFDELKANAKEEYNKKINELDENNKEEK